MYQAATAPGPPPTAREHGHNGVASARLRRTSAKTAKAGGGDGTSAELLSTSNQETGNNSHSSRNLTVREARPRGSRQESRRENLFIFDQPQREQIESSVTIATLQENLTAITAFNQREKALTASLNEEVARLTNELAKLNELREAEKLTYNKITSTQKEQPPSGPKERLLPDINGAVALTASTVALQQHTQMEVSYQRKVLSLENRCLHMTENNKKLLAKIQHLETSQTKEKTQLQTLRQDNFRLATQTENLASTISSQSALIIGLRTTLQKMSQDEHIADNLRKSLDHFQRDLDGMKKREKLLQEEHAKFKKTSVQEKETMMVKILSFQQHLQQSDTTEGIAKALETQVQKLQKEKAAVSVELEAAHYRCNDLLARLTLMDKVFEELAQMKVTMQKERENAEAELTARDQEINSYVQQLKAADTRIQEGKTRIREAEARNSSVQDLTTLINTRDEELATLMQKFVQLEGDLKDQEQRNLGLQDEVNRLNNELQNLKQLSQDETVQALQMARQKAANYEALTLLNEEKRSLEEQLQRMQERFEHERAALQEEKEAKEKLLVSLGLNHQILDELCKEETMLVEQTEQIRDVEKEVVQAAAPTTNEENITPDDFSQSNERLKTLQGQIDELRRSQGEMELGYKKLVSREKYKAESFQSQLRLVQGENTELTEKVEELSSNLAKEHQLTCTQDLEIADLRSRVMSSESIDLLRKTQDSLEKTVTSLMEAEHASESTFTCLQCMQLFTSPMTLAPCGHTYCAACLAKYGSVDEPSAISCRMCEGGTSQQAECIFPNHALADLTARFVFRQQSLATLTSMCLSLRNSFTSC
ncbi:hypothetical protein PHYBOEH_006025 [Phytophthora boehmeriae]|uniref:RING-type domain-containing protein n=1 Tax=Phytophthora boehmeriae TaxID=109152 RepID=A0A8T1WIR4_9STRA|nr:hypothetical protein PHYBOEH_006025 [Phytophthora boehmeriae]